MSGARRSTTGVTGDDLARVVEGDRPSAGGSRPRVRVRRYLGVMALVLIAAYIGYSLFIAVIGSGGVGVGTFLFLPHLIAYTALFVGPACIVATIGGLVTMVLSRRGSVSLQIWSLAAVTAVCVVSVLAVLQFPFVWYRAQAAGFDEISTLPSVEAVAGYVVVVVALAVALAGVGRRYIWSDRGRPLPITTA